MANRFKIIRGNKKNDDNEIITCNGLGLTRKQEKDILTKSKYQVGQTIYLAEDDGTIIEQGVIEEKFYDSQDDGSIDYVYSMMMQDEDSESFIDGIYQSEMLNEGFYSKEDYIQKYNKEPVYIPPTYDDMENEQLELFD
jgi:uncharacterized protein YfkK (UPF0435 family)